MPTPAPILPVNPDPTSTKAETRFQVANEINDAGECILLRCTTDATTAYREILIEPRGADLIAVRCHHDQNSEPTTILMPKGAAAYAEASGPDQSGPVTLLSLEIDSTVTTRVFSHRDRAVDALRACLLEEFEEAAIADREWITKADEETLDNRIFEIRDQLGIGIRWGIETGPLDSVQVDIE